MLLVASIGAVLLFIAYWRATNDCNAPIRGEVMKALKVCEYGVDRVQVAEVTKPVPSDDQVLVKVRAASLNALDVFMIRDTWFGRLFFGLRKPRDTGVGSDVAGQVEAVGKNLAAAREFKSGDEVFGIVRASFAEYAVSSGRGLVMKPSSISFEDAASVPLAGLTALQGLREGKIQPGQKILVNGATGGVGTFAVQIAKSLGAEVTAVCSTRNVDLVRSIGADHVIDYIKEDFTKSDQHYDMIFDNVCNHSFSERRRVLNPKGICVLAGMGGAGVKEGQAIGRIANNLFTARALSSFTEQKFVQYIAKVNKQDLTILGDLVEAGKIRPVIEQTYNLDDGPEALRQLDRGHARGKVVIQMDGAE